MLKTSGVGVIFCVLSGCASQQIASSYNDKLQPYKGLPASELTTLLGKPTQVLELKNGDAQYVYVQRKNLTTPVEEKVITKKDYRYPQYLPQLETKEVVMVGGEEVEFNCTTNFIINNESGKVSKITFNGNACLAS